MHIAASSSHHTLDANKETASSGGLAGNRRDKKGFWPVYYSLELFIIFTAFTDSEGGERLFIPKREGECVHSVSGVAVLCDGRKALDRRFQTGCLQLYPLLPCRVSEPHLKAAEEEKGGRGETNTRDIKSVIHGNSQTSRSQPAALRLALSA